jgi:hypothetical protein
MSAVSLLLGEKGGDGGGAKLNRECVSKSVLSANLEGQYLWFLASAFQDQNHRRGNMPTSFFPGATI